MLKKNGALNCFKRIQSTSQSKPIAPKKKINVKIKFEKKGMIAKSNQYSFDVAFPCFRMEKIYVKQVAFPQKTEHQMRSEEHTSELQSRGHLVCRLLLE